MISEKEYRYYQRLHQNRLNLVIHVIGSIMFIAGNILILIGLWNFIDFTQIIMGFSLLFVAISFRLSSHIEKDRFMTGLADRLLKLCHTP